MMETLLQITTRKADELSKENKRLNDKIKSLEMRFTIEMDAFNKECQDWLLAELNFKQKEILELQMELLTLNSKYKLLI